MTGRIVNVRPKPGFVMDGAGEVVPARGNVIPFARQLMQDRLTNVMSGMGTTADKAVYGGYGMVAAQPAIVEAAYRTSWLMRKIVDIPAIDMTRAGRAWQADSDQIELIEAEEKRLQLKAKLKRALVLARLWGGGAIVLGVKGQGDDPTKELDPKRATKGGLPWIKVYSRNQLQALDEIENPDDPWSGHPKSYLLSLRNGGQISLHPSRVIAFVGQPVPEGSMMASEWFWGDPLYQSIESALQNADLAQDGFAGLISEASIDVIKIPDLMESWSTTEYEAQLTARLAATKRGKSTWRALILDGAEEWDQRQTTWTGMPDMITSYLQIIAGAADIPVTRLLGQSPKGLQSTGEGEEKDYHAMIEARQDEILTPALDRIDQFLIPSALGSLPPEIWWRFNPLMRLSPKDAMEIETKRATTLKTYGDAGLIAPDALTKIAENAMSESGQWPGCDEAFDEATMDPGATEPPDPAAELALMTPEEIAAQQAAVPPKVIDAKLIGDAQPRTLYVSRKLINGADLIAWAKAQGFKTTQPASALHVTIAFSRTAVDWMKVGDDWSGDADGKIRVKPGGPRVVEPLGDKGAVVLLFRSDDLEYRHNRIHDEAVGAVWDHPEYQPHVTITWDGAGIDLAKVEPYQGPLVFGPEIFAEVVDDWESTITES